VYKLTPHELATAHHRFITEYGVIRPPFSEAIPDLETRPRLLLSAAP